MVEFFPASPSDALTIVKTRQKAWASTYRGIYPDDAIDRFDYEWHLKAEQQRLKNPNFHCFMVMDEAMCVGYYSYGTMRDQFWLHSLYLMPNYQGCGLGRRIFEIVKHACLDAGYHTMYLDCHPANHRALGFYLHMGGKVIMMDSGHENHQEDGCTIEYCFI